MKGILRLSLLAAMAFLVVITCKKDDEGTKITATSGTITAKSDSAKYIFEVKEAVKDTFAKDSVRILIDGEASNGASISIDLQNMYKLKAGSFKTAYNLKTKQYVAVRIRVGNVTYESIKSGDLTITTYNEDIIQGTFNVTVESYDDSTKTFKLNGQFNCSFTGFDPSIKDIEVLPGSMEARVNNQLFFFNVLAADIKIDSSRMINITGTRDDRSIVLQLINFQPWSGKTYTTGNFYSNEGGYIKASYIKNNTVSFIANEKDTLAATIKIVKISASSIQGYFDFSASSPKDTAHIEVRSGKFNARFKIYQ
jgi:hypothetical protein